MTLAALLLVVVGAAATESEQFLFDHHRWFELRERRSADPLVAGGVASAFGQVREAERLLRKAIVASPGSGRAQEAHTRLMYMYLRMGRTRAALAEAESIYRLPGEADGIRNVRGLLAALARYPDQSIGRKRRLRTRWSTKAGGFTIPVEVNGRMVQWIFDTGFNFCGISEAEARMLGVRVIDVEAVAHDSAGGSTTVRAAVVPKLTIGGVAVRNVAFLVIPDSQPPMKDLPPTERGIIGLPVAVALGTVRWDADGLFEAGFKPRAGLKAPNLCFDELNPVLRVQGLGKDLDFVLDTGNGGGTQLWERLARDFPLLLEKGSKAIEQIGQIGGTNMREAIVVPEVPLRLPGLDVVLRPARVFSKPVGNEFHHGLLGMDVLYQAREVTIDFRAMTVVVK